MQNNVQQVEDYIGDVKGFLYDHFDIDESDRESIGEVNVKIADEFYESTDGYDALSAYVGDNGENSIIVNNQVISDTDHQITKSAVGEEMSHIIHQNIAQSFSEYLDVPSDAYMSDLADVRFEDWIKYNTVTEMVGRAGSVYTAIEFDSSLDEGDSLEKLGESIAGSNDADSEDIDPENFLEMFLPASLEEMSRSGVKTTMDHATHDAGYRAAEQNINDIASGETIMNKEVDQIWNEYGLKDHVISSLSKLPHFENMSK